MSSNKKTAAPTTPEVTAAPPKRQKNIRLALLLLVMLIAGFGVAFAATKQLARTDSGSTDTNGKVIHYVDITSDNKDPIDLLIKKDEYVQFNSKDGGKHQIVHSGSDHGAAHGAGGTASESKVFNGDEGYLLQFKEIGKFEFQDKLDSDYTISVIVYDPSKSAEDIKIKP